MGEQTPELFWDTCVFCAHLYDEVDQYGEVIDHIRQYIREARAGKWRIITSSIVFAELAFSKVKRDAPGTMEDLRRDIEAACLLIDPNPNIMMLAGKLRDIPYRKHQSRVRRLTVPDAVMLATALFVQEHYLQNLRAFHTFDAGGKKREVPLIGYEEWLDGLSDEQLTVARRAANLRRERPFHPTPDLLDIRATPALGRPDVSGNVSAFPAPSSKAR